MVSALSFDSMGTNNVLNSFLGSAGSSLTGTAGGNMNVGNLLGTGFSNGYGYGPIDPYYGHTPEEWARLTPEERQVAKNKYFQDQLDAKNARIIAATQAQNGINAPELAIKSAVENLHSCIMNSDDRMVNEAFNTLVELIQKTPTYHVRETDANGKGTTRRRTDAEAKATAMELYKKYTGRDFVKDVKENCDSSFWTGVGNALTFGALDDDCASSILDNAFNREGGKVAQKTGGALTGATIGAAAGAGIGSVVPVVGTAVGAVVGGIIGGICGLFS